MAKQGFSGQWVQLAKIGTATDSEGVPRDLNKKFLEKVVANYNAGEHDAPLVVGHPTSDSAPAYGWASEIRLSGDLLEARFSDTDDDFEQLVADGRYKKRSASFYLDPPNLHHIGFLGAKPPSIKGLRNIQFADGESITIETFNLQEKNMGLEDTDVDKVTTGVFEKLKSLFKPEAAAKEPDANSAQFSEAKVTEIVTAAIAAARTELTANFKEQLDAKETKIGELETRINAGAASGVRSEIASFVESFPAEKGKHYLKRIGIASFLESLAVADGKDEKKAISFSEGDGDTKVSHEFSRLEFAKNLLTALPAMISFGEKFGNIVATKEADQMINMDRVNEMKAAAGVAINGGEK